MRRMPRCAIAVCKALGLDDAQIEAGLASYPGLAHRMERIGEVDGVLYVNDSKATNPTSTAPALAAFPDDPLDFGRAGKDRRSRRLPAISRQCPCGLHHRAGWPDAGQGAGAAYCGDRMRDDGRRGDHSGTSSDSPARRFCCHRPAHPTTSFVTLKHGAMRFAGPCRLCKRTQGASHDSDDTHRRKHTKRFAVQASKA